MRTIERNYTKNPHTARFLQTFHSAIGSNGVNYRETLAAPEVELAAADDLLDLVPETPVDRRSTGQASFMEDLIGRLTKLDPAAGRSARDFTDLTTRKGGWTPGKSGNASEWINRMIRKETALKAAAPVVRPTTGPVVVADGRYAVEEDGVLKFFKVKNGRRPGFVFLDIQASDDWFPVRAADRRAAILASIAQDPKAAMIRYGKELGECGRCGRTLTDEASRAAGIGPVCISR